MNVLAIFSKEVKAYFASPIAYVVLAIFAVINGYFFYSMMAVFHLISLQATLGSGLGMPGLNPADGVFRPLFRNMSVLLLVVVPVITMRLFSEEKKSKTFELLFSYPLRDLEVLLGKFLAALLMYAAMLSITLLYPAIVSAFITLPWGQILSGYVGLLLLGIAYLAAGILMSSLTENQIVAAIGAFGLLLLFWAIGWSADWAGPVLGPILLHLSLIEHYEPFAKGVMESKHAIYYLNFGLFALFLTLWVLDGKRWRG